MKQLLSVFFLLSCAAGISNAQVLNGNIKDQSGNPIPYATVYISEIRQGTTANSKGDYSLKLPAGNYTVTIQSLGYEPVYLKITLFDQPVTRDVVLPVQYYQIPEVRVTASGEDPAYIIMRKVIGMAPYYLNNISSYKAEVYLKGNLVIKNIPRIIERQLRVQQKKGEEIKLKDGDSFFMESYNEIRFTAPDRYFQRVISQNSTFPEQGNEISPMTFIKASFYQPEIAEMAISPLSPSAFSHYNFKYIGLSMQGDYVINKIQVIPKRKSQQLFEGTIFIIEDLWCLHSVDLINENIAGKIRIQQLYVPVQDDIWLPASHKFDVDISILGVKAVAGYGSSVKYLEVTPNTALKKPETITTNTPSKSLAESNKAPVSKSDEQINKILSKDELTNSDMVKLSRLMEKKSEKSQPDSIRKNLEVKDRTIQRVEKDAGKKDSIYWEMVRPIPLSDAEKKAIRVSDSVKALRELREIKQDTVVYSGERKKKNAFLNTLRYAATGYTWSDTTGSLLRFGGLVDPKNFAFNTVDGFVYGFSFTYNKSARGKNLYVSPDIKWAFSRQSLIWKVNSFYRFNSNRLNQVYFRAGHASVDFNTGGGINLFLNTSFSLLMRKNNLKLYESGYLTLGYLTDLSPGLNIDLSGTFENRHKLENTTDFSIFRPAVKYTPNTPVNEYLLPGVNPLYAIRNMRHAAFMTVINWTPNMRYRVSGKRKIPEGSDWPTFTFTWRHGINEFRELDPSIRHYEMLRFEVARRDEIGAFSEIKWRVRTGGFINKKNVTFYDFYHVNSQPLPLLLNGYEDAFRLPAFYSMSTPEFYVQGHFTYITPYLALKYIPFLSNTLMRENLNVSYMGSMNHKHYTELGYSVSEIFLIGELGFYVGFENVKYKSAGISLTLRLK
jgi:hypothetical protein